MTHPLSARWGLAPLLAALVAAPALAAPTDDVPAPATFSGDAVTWTPSTEHAGVLVILRGADGAEARRAFSADQAATLTAVDVAALGLPDGEYAHDVVVLTPGTTPDAALGLGQTGRIAVRAGQIAELSAPVITGNQTIREALCVGFQCADNESYGVTDLLLKADNLTVVLEDTSTSPSYLSE